MRLTERVLRTIRRHGLVPRGGRVLVALSGGPDSVALVHLLRELEPSGELSVVGLAHLNHGIRGAEADEDERFCRGMAEALSLPIDVGRENVPALAAHEHRSIEDAARTVRYAFLERVVSRLHADVVATGHSRDDQAETFLLRLIRGAGPRGLAGIFPRAGRIVRPLLDVRRAELREYAAEHQLAFREDATNQDVGIPRNRLRHELIPYLERELSPGIVEVLAREAAIARDDEDRLHAEAIELVQTGVSMSGAAGCDQRGPRAELDAAWLVSLHPALASRVAREVLARVAPGRFAGFDQVADVLALGRGETAAVSLPGAEAVRQGSRIAIGPPAPPAFSNSFRFPLSIPGEVLLSAQGWAVSAAWENPARGQTPDGQLHTVVQAGSVRLPLTVRSRRPGDRLRPAGMGGRSKKLQDLFVDRRVGRAVRDLVPLVVDADDRIVWVVGEPVSEDFRVTGPSQGVILLKARRLGGPG